MTATVTIVHPKHRPWQERLRHWLPAFYERAVLANNRRMDEGLFRSIIDQLVAWNHTGVVNLFSNNEPFLDRRICDFADYARDKLPGAFLQVISNGAALDVPRVERILPKLSRLIVNNYSRTPALNPNIAAIVAHLDARRPELAGRMVVGLRLLDEFKTNRAGNAPNRSRRPAPAIAGPGDGGYTSTESVPVSRVASRGTRLANSRKPVLARFRSRCAYPFFQMVIRPDGKISLCCNDALGEVTIGDVSQQPLPVAWASPERRAVQAAMLRGRDAIALCAGCDNLSWAKPRRITAALATGTFTE